MNELTRAERWLYRRLTGDARLAELVGGRVYGHTADPEAAYPLVVFFPTGGHDTRVVGGMRVMSRETFAVKVIGRGASLAPLEEIADRIDAALQGAAGAVPGLEIASCVRERAFAYAETDGGEEYRHLGGYYRLLIVPSANE